MPTTRFTLITGGGPLWSDAYALGTPVGLEVPVSRSWASPSIAVGDGRNVTLSRERADGRYELLNLAASLGDPPAALSPGQVSAPEAYVPWTLAVLAVPTGQKPDVGGGAPVLAWPGPALPGQGVEVSGTSCAVMGGADLAPVLAAAGQARCATAWSDGRSAWTLSFRPLLSEEDGCADLANKSG